MTVASGARIGDCEILGPLGAGGMGEVYRARDNSLGREVAIKVLPEQLASDAERLRRFEKEARSAAALNHPNILAVYRFGTTEQQTPYLVTELLQGQTLRERLQQGPIPARKVVDYGSQIAHGLAAAHDRGIVHRDLKPENLFLTRDGVVKILDFGLAKLIHPEKGDAATTTLTSTKQGQVLGTIGYMSPEQVRGLNVDQRSDIFSFGAVLYEMLTGKRTFHAKTVADTMSAILKEEPAEVSNVVPNLPPALVRVVHRCLEKETADRFQSARDLAFNLDLLTRAESGSGSSVAIPQKRAARWWRPVGGALLIAIAAATGVIAGRKIGPRAAPFSSVTLRRLTDFVGMEESPALSPDGKSVAFTADVTGRRQLWMRLLRGGAPLQVTHDDGDHQFPRWSADSASLIYYSPSSDPDGQGKLWSISALGGTARPIATSMGGGDLSHDGEHLAYFQSNQGRTELVVTQSDGSGPRVVATLPSEYNYSELRWSPDDRKLGFQRGRTFDYDVFDVPVEGGQPEQITRDANPLAGFAWLPDSSGVVYSSSRGDTVLYLRTMNLWSVRTGGKDLRRLTFGETGYTDPDVDRSGNIAATRLGIQFDVWRYPVDGTPEDNVRRGVQITHQTGSVQTPSVGPGDRELAYLSDTGGHGNLWVMDLATGQSRQVTFEQDPQVTVGVPVWSPDGKYIAYVKRGDKSWNVDQWLMNPDGSNSRKVSAGGGWACWSPDSRWLYVAPPGQNDFRIEKIATEGGAVVPVQALGQKPAVAADGTLYFTRSLPAVNGVSDMEIRRALPENGESQTLARISGSRLSDWLLMQPVISPDGKWLAMMLTDGPATNLWALPTGGGPMRKITDFGHNATFMTRRVSWSTDGKSIFAAVGKGEADIVLLSNLLVP